jgi:hypothetical protein
MHFRSSGRQDGPLDTCTHNFDPGENRHAAVRPKPGARKSRRRSGFQAAQDPALFGRVPTIRTIAGARTERVSAAGAGDEGGDDVGGVAVE